MCPPCPWSRPCEVCGQKVRSRSLGTHLASAETFSWRDPFLAGMGQRGKGGLSRLSHWQDLTLWLCLRRAATKGLTIPRAHTQTHPTLTLLSWLYRLETWPRGILSQTFFTGPHQPLLDLALSNEKWAQSPGVSWVIYREVYFHMAFQLQPTPRVRGREREHRKWIGGWETDVWSLQWQGILQLNPLFMRLEGFSPWDKTLALPAFLLLPQPCRTPGPHQLLLHLSKVHLGTLPHRCLPCWVISLF